MNTDEFGGLTECRREIAGEIKMNSSFYILEEGNVTNKILYETVAKLDRQKLAGYGFRKIYGGLDKCSRNAVCFHHISGGVMIVIDTRYVIQLSGTEDMRLSTSSDLINLVNEELTQVKFRKVGES
ncbi:hypothetical protein J4462_00845 [Candidatus Pacearchaeota archaeon]|nr:hypothetical protein [Candidatus Pacearchaeota archaeon]